MIGMDGNYIPWDGEDPNHYSEDYSAGQQDSLSEEKAEIINRRQAEMHPYIQYECEARGIKVRYEDTRNMVFGR